MQLSHQLSGPDQDKRGYGAMGRLPRYRPAIIVLVLLSLVLAELLVLSTWCYQIQLRSARLERDAAERWGSVLSVELHEMRHVVAQAYSNTESLDLPNLEEDIQIH